MRRFFCGIAVFAAIMLLAIPLRAQDYQRQRNELVQKQQDTRQKIEELNDQIGEYQQRLSQAEEKFDRLFSQYEDLKRVIALQEEKISKLQEELDHIRSEIDITEKEIAKNEENLERLVDNYKKTLSYIYKHGRSSQLALILSSASINQMLVRSYYLGKFEEYRQKQVEQIEKAQEELKRNRTQLEDAREKNSAVLAEIRQEKAEQEKQRERQEENVALLRRDRNQLQNEVEKRRQQQEELSNQLADLFEEMKELDEQRIRALEAERIRRLAEARDIEDPEERAREVAKYSEPITREDYLNDSELNAIESSFASNRGSLPWPVSSGTISEHFGRKRHPVYGTVTENLGIEIVTNSQDPVRVVHDGYVVDIRPIPGYGDVVVVRHGKYFTAYGNLSQVMVNKNSVLKTGDVIGLSGDQNSARGLSVFFMVRENNQNQDPEKWLSDKS